MIPTDTLPGGNRQRRKEARPQEILDAALDVFVRKGFAATRTEDVATGAGVSKGTLYLYYPSKEELLKAVIRHHLSTAIAEGAQRFAQHEGSMHDLLDRVLVEWWMRLFESPASGVFKLIVTEVRNFPEIAAFYASEVIEPGQSLLRRVIENGIAAGEFRRVDIDNTVHSIVLPMVMLCLYKHSVGACAPASVHIDPRRFIHEHIALMLRGMAAEPAPAAAVAPAARAARRARA